MTAASGKNNLVTAHLGWVWAVALSEGRLFLRSHRRKISKRFIDIVREVEVEESLDAIVSTRYRCHLFCHFATSGSRSP